ncbi:transposable element Tcb1 transposase [Trichonephila clavipes]|nr:transposable element Tcb1 transposase [Trichonephila clavipes]
MFSDKSRFSLQSNSRRSLLWRAPECNDDRPHIYRDVILEQHVRLFRGAVGAQFLFIDENARPHHANIVDECLQLVDITRMDWPAYLPELHPIEHVWDMLGRRNMEWSSNAVVIPFSDIGGQVEGLWFSLYESVVRVTGLVEPVFICDENKLPLIPISNLYDICTILNGLSYLSTKRDEKNRYSYKQLSVKKFSGDSLPVVARATQDCRLPKWEAKTRYGVSFVPTLLMTLEEDLKQQPVYQDSPKASLLDLSLEIEQAIRFAPNQDLQDILQQLQLSEVVNYPPSE